MRIFGIFIFFILAYPKLTIGGETNSPIDLSKCEKSCSVEICTLCPQNIQKLNEQKLEIERLNKLIKANEDALKDNSHASSVIKLNSNLLIATIKKETAQTQFDNYKLAVEKCEACNAEKQK